MYRDYWVADLTFTSFATLLFAMASFHPTVRSSICEEISRQPQLTSELGEAGLDLEDCEPWLQRTVVAGVGLMAIMLIVRVRLGHSTQYACLVLILTHSFNSHQCSRTCTATSYTEQRVIDPLRTVPVTKGPPRVGYSSFLRGRSQTIPMILSFTHPFLLAHCQMRKLRNLKQRRHGSLAKITGSIVGLHIDVPTQLLILFPSTNIEGVLQFHTTR